MKWEEAVKASPEKTGYRILTDGRLSYVDANGITKTQIKLNDRFKFTTIGPQGRNRRKDWKPMPKGFMTDFNLYGLEKESVPAVKAKEEFEKVGLDVNFTIAPDNKPSDNAVKALADLASRWLDKGHEIQAAFVTQLLGRYIL